MTTAEAAGGELGVFFLKKISAPPVCQLPTKRPPSLLFCAYVPTSALRFRSLGDGKEAEIRVAKKGALSKSTCVEQGIYKIKILFHRKNTTE